MRRSFRLGLRVGLLLGIVAAAIKVAQTRRATQEVAAGGWNDTPTAWDPPAPPSPPAATPTATAALAPDPGVDAEIAHFAPAAETVGPPATVPAPPAAAERQPAATAAAPETPNEPAPAAPDHAPDAPSTLPPATPDTPGAPAAAPVKKARKAASVTSLGDATPTRGRQRPLKAVRKEVPAALWVEPTGATCPPSHPVKAKLASRLFHLPGMFAYERTRPDRCYRDAGSAEDDGFRSAKR